MVVFFYRDLVTLRDTVRIGGEMVNAYSEADNTQYQIVTTGQGDWEYEVVIDQETIDNSDHHEEIENYENQLLGQKEDKLALPGSSPLYTQVESTYPCSLPVPGCISPSDIRQFRSSSSSTPPLKLADIQRAGHNDYGSCGLSPAYRDRSNYKV